MMMLKDKLMRPLALAAAVSVSAVSAMAQDVPPPLPVEPTGVIESLPSAYPPEWFLVQDSSFFHMSDGKVYVIDSSADSLGEQVKGMFNNTLMGNILPVASRSEIMSVESFHTRGSRGDRLDVLTIWDQANLSPVAEVILPGSKRFMGMPERVVLQTLNNDKWLAIFNFSPAASVSLVDLDGRELMGEIPIPGCSFIYRHGQLSFTSLCADGRLLTVHLNRDGTEQSRSHSDVFFDSDDTPIFERPARVGAMAYFPTFDARVHPVAMAGETAAPMASWSLVAEDEQNWAPSGIGIDGEDALGRIYFLMNPEANGVDGMHNAGGSEIWVYDPEARRRVLRIPLKEWGLSFAVSRGQEPKVLVTNPVDMSVELYDGLSGEFVRKITGFGQETPLFLWGSR